ncbi:MAG: TusE/DsrC/DsvC family sulfur relay protein [Gammaproteobacteria bacterium]|nr:TusE/DsrC/DsvC family sulfur relay protein [Gammaproteobacteria bacterium]
MNYEVNGSTIEADANGYLVNGEEWTKEVAGVIAAAEGVELSDKAWEIINYMREEFYNNNGNQPNERNMVKHFKDVWGPETSQNSLYQLFPRGPAKQSSKIGGLPETRRKGGY